MKRSCHSAGVQEEGQHQSQRVLGEYDELGVGEYHAFHKTMHPEIY